MTDHKLQYRAFMAVVCALLVVSILPILAAWQLRLSLPDSLLSVADKAITAFGTLLGTIGGLMFRANGADGARAEADRTSAETARILADKQPPATITAPSEPAS